MQSFYGQLKGPRCSGKQAQQRKEENMKYYKKSNKKLNALIEKIIQKFVKNKKRMKTKEVLQNFQELQCSDNEGKKSISSFEESIESIEITSSSKKKAQTNYLLHV